MRDCFAAELANRVGGSLGALQVTIRDEYVGAFLGESNRGRPSDSARGAGDEGVSALESESHR